MREVSLVKGVSMSASGIIRIPILPMNMVNAYAIFQERAVILFDAGLPGSEAKVRKALQDHGYDFEDVGLIVISHAHVDHAGNAARLSQLCQAPIQAHAGDLAYYQRQRRMSFCSTGWFGRLFLKSGLMYQDYTAFTPDILLSHQQSFALHEFGIAGTVHATAGHTAGSLVIELENQEVLAGDLLASGILLGGIVWQDRPKQPPFEDDSLATALALERLLERGACCFHLGHGGPLADQAVRNHVHALRRIGNTRQ